MPSASVSVSVSVSVFLCFLLLCSVCGDDSKFYDCSHIHWICFRYINSQHNTVRVLRCVCSRVLPRLVFRVAVANFRKQKFHEKLFLSSHTRTLYIPDSVSAAPLLSGVVCAAMCCVVSHFSLATFFAGLLCSEFICAICVNILCRNQYLNEISGNEMGNTAPAQWIICFENQTNAIHIHLFISCICTSHTHTHIQHTM